MEVGVEENVLESAEAVRLQEAARDDLRIDVLARIFTMAALAFFERAGGHVTQTPVT